MNSEGKNRAFWGKKTFCFITGASQGIGRTLAVAFSRLFAENSTVVLLARSERGLEETKFLILETNSEVNVKIFPVDLSLPHAQVYRLILGNIDSSEYDVSLLVHNAGSVGNIGHLAEEMNDPQEWERYMALNLYSVTTLTSEFLKVFKSGHRCILNITSLCAVKPFKSMGYYCVGKAAREMYFRVLAEENPSLDILNYSPGPVDTSMIDTVIASVKDEETKATFIGMKSEKKLVPAQETVKKLINILATGNYTRGGRVDYFDRV